MSQRTIISETERERILKMHNKAKSYHILKEDESMEDPRVELNRAIQRFLNEKKITDAFGKSLKVDGSIGPYSRTQEAIEKYQRSIGAPIGEWRESTWEKMPPKDVKRLKWLIADEGGIIPKFLNWIGLD
jgi:hypothetical protein